MFCPKCGEQARPGHKFCQGCGAALPVARVSEEPHVEPVTRGLGHAIRSKVGALGTVPAFPQLLPRIAGGAVILVSVFLPYGGLGTSSLWGIVIPILFSIQSVGEMVPVGFLITVAGFVLLLMGGIMALVRRLTGAMLAITGIFFLSVPLHLTVGGFAWLSVMGFGYYGTWAGAIVCLIPSFRAWRAKRAGSSSARQE
ncbi:MAG: zinc-ribbon domain-containing protein, partial [Candidatus Geothermarchaeales archaeon]